MTERKEMLPEQGGKPQTVLLVYYSYSGQTGVLINRLAAGLKEQGIKVFFEKLKPVNHLRFPVGSIFRTYLMMLVTFFRRRVPIKELSPKCSREYDLVILAGPTWSYNPSGPVLSFLDLRKKLDECGALFSSSPIVFTHPSKEPWRTIGVFLKIAGRNPERSGFMSKHYNRFGHSSEQMEEAFRFGVQIGQSLKSGFPLREINFKTDIALP